MDLLGLRQVLVKETGHYEMVTDAAGGDWSDNGANEHINNGSRWLYDNFLGKDPEAWLYKSVSAGQAKVTFQVARIVKEVWIAQDGVGRTRLDRVDLATIREMYPETALSYITPSTPLYWAPLVLGLAPEQKAETHTTLTNAGITDTDLLTYGDAAYPLQGIVVLPPPSTAYTIEVLAEWYMVDLSADTDKNFWSVQRPDLLKKAAKMEMETDLHRNTQGRADFEGPLREALQALYHKKVAEEMAGPHSRFVMPL